MAERRPAGYPKLKNYKPSRFMLSTSHYDRAKADRAVKFIENLCHTKGKWAGKRFWLLPWQEQLIRDIFGIVKPDGYRQFRTAFVEICKKVGKSELAAAVALYLLYTDNEPSAEVYGAAADRQQASIVFDVARQMVEMSPALLKRSKLMTATKRIVNYGNSGYYQSRMNGYATARQNGWMSANDIRELENLDRIPAEQGGDLYLINGNMTKLEDAGIFAADGGSGESESAAVEEQGRSHTSRRRSRRVSNR